MKTCANCGYECSDDAVVCEYCGYPLNPIAEKKQKKKISKSNIFAILIVLSGLLLCAIINFFNEPLITFVEQKNATALNLRLGFSKDLVDSTVQTSFFWGKAEEESLLEYCIEQNCGIDIFNTLIENGADINFKSACGRTPFSLAIERNQTTYLRELINKGVDINQEIVVRAFGIHDLTTINALEYSVLYATNTDIALMLIDAGANPSIEVTIEFESNSVTIPLLTYVAVRREDKELVSALARAGADINKTDETGQTVLEWCINQNQDLEMIRLLIELGADLNHEDSLGDSVLAQAFKYSPENKELIYLLLDNGANPNSKVAARQGEKTISVPLLTYVAVLQDDKEMVSTLVRAGADISNTDETGQTALEWCINQDQDLEMIKLLVELGADLNHEDSHGRTPLMISIAYNVDISIVQYLIDSTLDINKPNSKQLSPLQFAVTNNANIDIIKSLIYEGSDLSKKTQYGTSIIDLSREYSSEETTSYLEFASSAFEFGKNQILDEAAVFTAEEKQKASELYYQFYQDFGIYLIFITADNDILSVDLPSYSKATLDKYNLDPFPRILIVINSTNSYMSWHTSTELTDEQSDILLDIVGNEYWADAKFKALLSFEKEVRKWKESVNNKNVI